MTRKKIKTDQELRLLIYMITNDHFMREIYPIFRPQYLQTTYGKIVSQWIVEYYENYHEAPKRNIQELYKSKRGLLKNDDDIDNVANFLKGLDDQWEQLEPNNIDFCIAESTGYLKLRSLELLKETINDAVAAGDSLKGEAAISDYKRVERSYGAGASILHDASAVVKAFSEEDELLFKFPGAVGLVAGPFNRGDFMSFIAPMKRGKTWWLWYTAEIAAHHQLKVLLFTLEMTEQQMIRRGWQGLVGQPRNKCTIKMPKFIQHPDDANKYKIDINEEEREALRIESVEEMQEKLRRRFRKGDIRIISLPAYSATVDDLDSHLDNLNYYDNFIPDVIIVDYADILAPTKGFRGEYRHQLDDIWKRLRRMAQERNCLVATATQAEKKTFKADVNEADVAEDIRKLAHVTCMLALNQNKQEAENGIMRLSQIAIREGKRTFQQALVLSCLEIGRPCLSSKLRNEVIYDLPGQQPQGYEKKRRDNGKDD